MSSKLCNIVILLYSYKLSQTTENDNNVLNTFLNVTTTPIPMIKIQRINLVSFLK